MDEKTFISKMIADNRVTIPAKIRKQHGLVIGDHVELHVIRKVNRTGEEKE